MFDVKAKKTESNVLTIKNPTPRIGHQPKRGAGSHSDKRHRRTNKKSRNIQAIREEWY